MAKCIRCGKSTALRGNVKISDANLCMTCFKELGFEKRDLLTASLYKYDEIKDGQAAYYANKWKNTTSETDGITFAHYGETREVDATESEAEIYQTIKSLLNDMGCNTDCLSLVRKSDSYVSAVMESSGDYGLMDLARFKFTDRAKWIKLGPNFDKVALKSTEDVADMTEEIRAAYLFNEPYL